MGDEAGVGGNGPPAESGILQILQAYQRVIREWMPHLTANEFAVVMQVLDRTVGWQKPGATFRSAKLLGGDTLYGGMGRAMHRSTMMKVLRKLQDRGIVMRRPDRTRPWLRTYSVNLSWIPSTPPE